MNNKVKIKTNHVLHCCWRCFRIVFVLWALDNDAHMLPCSGPGRHWAPSAGIQATPRPVSLPDICWHLHTHHPTKIRAGMLIYKRIETDEHIPLFFLFFLNSSIFDTWSDLCGCHKLQVTIDLSNGRHTGDASCSPHHKHNNPTTASLPAPSLSL